jgi:hypothetical protein
MTGLRTKTKVRAFDLAAGENAFKQLESALRAMTQDEIMPMTVDAQEAALAALALVSVARDPKRLERLSLLMPALLEPKAIDQLELAAWATWYAHTQLQTELAQAKGAKVDADTYEASGRHLNKLLKLVEYHVGDQPRVAVELADIRSGAGYQDRATDLVRAAALFDRHHDELEQDARYYDAGLGDGARRYAEAIVESLRASLGRTAAEWSDLRSRAWSQMVQLYDQVRAAGEYVFRNEPEQADLFQKLRQVVVPNRRMRKDPTPADPPETPASVAGPNGPAARAV